MAENLISLQRQAVKLGKTPREAKAMSRKALERYVSGGGGNGDAPKVTKKKVVKKAVAKKQTPARKQTRKAAPKAAPKAAKPKAQRTRKTKAAENGDAGRFLIGTLDYSVTDGWNPRKGSPVERIFRSLKKHRGNTEKVFTDLKSDIWDFVGKKKRDGSKRDKASAEAMLKYRINRTRFQFATQTGQHETSPNRVEYGTGVYAQQRPQKSRKASKTSGNKTGRKAAPRKAKARKTVRK